MKTTKSTVERCEAPEGFVYHPVLLATIDNAATVFDVTPRTIRNWITADPDPAPAVHRGDEGLPPLINVGHMSLWLMLQRTRNSSFGKHGGSR